MSEFDSHVVTICPDWFYWNVEYSNETNTTVGYQTAEFNCWAWRTDNYKLASNITMKVSSIGGVYVNDTFIPCVIINNEYSQNGLWFDSDGNQHGNYTVERNSKYEPALATLVLRLNPECFKYMADYQCVNVIINIGYEDYSIVLRKNQGAET